MNPRAPVYTATFDLAAWVLANLGRGPLAWDTGRLCLALLDAVVLALKDRERWERLDAADENLLRLRQRLRLAQTTGLIDERQALHALGLCDDIGRQIGGWIKSLEEAQ